MTANNEPEKHMKIYTVRIITEGVVLAANADEARDQARDIQRTESLNHVEVDEGATTARPWASSALVYGKHDEDMTYAEALIIAALD